MDNDVDVLSLMVFGISLLYRYGMKCFTCISIFDMKTTMIYYWYISTLNFYFTITIHLSEENNHKQCFDLVLWISLYTLYYFYRLVSLQINLWNFCPMLENKKANKRSVWIALLWYATFCFSFLFDFTLLLFAIIFSPFTWFEILISNSTYEFLLR